MALPPAGDGVRIARVRSRERRSIRRTDEDCTENPVLLRANRKKRIFCPYTTWI